LVFGRRRDGQATAPDERRRDAVDWKNIQECLRLRDLGDGRYEATNYELDYHRVFSGQILAQSIAALADLADGMAVKSLTQLFSREGSHAEPMAYTVEERHRGRTFASYAVSAHQGDRIVGTSVAALHRPDAGYERADDPPRVGSPNDATPVEVGMVPWDIRVVDGVDLQSPGARPARYSFWMKVPAGHNEDWFHQALLAHATALTLIGTGLLPVDGISQADTGTRIATAVTSHSVWFHQQFRLDEWTLVDQTSPVMSAGRCFGRGDVWKSDGRLVASFTQEAMIRPIGD
jgi:acyl-CoA thioesterase-2